MTMQTTISSIVGLYGVSSVLDGIIRELRDHASLMDGEYPESSRDRRQLAIELERCLPIAQSIQN